MSAFSSSRSRFQQPFDPIIAVLFKIIQAITYLFVLAALFMNPDAKTGIIDPKAEYILTVTWQDNSPDDIDTWVEDPDGQVIWFRNPAAGLLHLDRDDRGMINDTIIVNGEKIQNPLNQEVLTIRGIVKGEYVVNLHYYASETKKPVEVNIRLDKVNPALEVIYYGKVTLEKTGDEKTALRFRIGNDEKISDINFLPKHIVMLEQH